MATTNGQEFPDRKGAIVAAMIVFSVLSTAVVMWRLVVVYLAKRKWPLSEYSMVVAVGLNIFANVSSIISAYNGQGRHMKDPSVTPAMLVECLKYMYFSQFSNVLAMAFLKAALCAYLLSLNFSPRYRAIIWCAIVLVATTNFILPSIVLFGNCRPLSLRWNKNQPGSCWPRSVNAASGYTQSASNIVTDIIFTSSPLVYLKTVQLAKRTQWGLRAVFLLGLTGTICSIVKLCELNFLSKGKDPTYDSVDLTIWSAAEVATGMIVSCLPLLRKTFDRLLKHVVPPTTLGSSKDRSTTGRSGVNSFHMVSHLGKPKSHMQISDDESERAIFAEQENDKGIVKTLDVTISSDARDRGYKEDWSMPNGRV